MYRCRFVVNWNSTKSTERRGLCKKTVVRLWSDSTKAHHFHEERRSSDLREFHIIAENRLLHSLSFIIVIIIMIVIMRLARAIGIWCFCNPLIPTLKPHSNGPLYSNTVVDTLAVDGRAVTFGTARGRVGPGHCCYRIGPMCFLAGWRKRRPEPGLVWFR